MGSSPPVDCLFVIDWTPVDLLPGLWLGLVGALLAAALRRWYDPVPGWVLAVFAAGLLIVFAPVLFGGAVLLPLDGLPQRAPDDSLIRIVTPLQSAVREALEQGRWPLWNRRMGAGMPLLADPQSQALQPLTLLGIPLPLLRAAGFVAALRGLVALVFSFLGLRRVGLKPGLALAGALAWGFLGFLILGTGGPLANLVALVPLTIYAVVRCDEPGGRRDSVLLAFAFLSLLFSGPPEAVLYALGVSLLVLLFRFRLRRPFLVRVGTALLVAAAVAAPILLPTLRYLPKAMRGPGRFQVASGLGEISRHRTLPPSESIGAVAYGLAIHPQKGYRMAALGDDFPPGLAALYGLEDARVDNPMAPKTYRDLLASGLTDPLYQRLGVRYLLTRLDASLPAPWERIFADRTAAVWEQPFPFPLLFIAADKPAGGVLIQRIEDTWISGPASLRRRQWLGTRLYQDGGWILLIDGLPRATSGAPFLVARLPRGEMRLDLLYRPAEFVWGWLIAALGLVAGAAAWMPRPARPSARQPEGETSGTTGTPETSKP